MDEYKPMSKKGIIPVNQKKIKFNIFLINFNKDNTENYYSYYNFYGNFNNHKYLSLYILKYDIQAKHYNILYYNKENIILLKQNINNKFQNEYKISKEKKINKINIKGLAINKKRKYSQKDRIKNGKKLMNI